MKSKLITLVVGLCIGSFYASTAIAASIFWNAQMGGDFDDPLNWTPMMVPGVMDNPIFDLPAAYTVSFPDFSLITTGPLNVIDGEVTFSIDGAIFDFYDVDGNVDIGGSLPPPPSGSPPAVSLAVNVGRLDAGSNNITVHDGAALKGDGQVEGNELVINGGGQLRGSLTVSAIGGVVNSGAVAPGDGAGVIVIGGDYQQSASGLLEIEVGGLSGGSQHDQLLLFVSNIDLAGRLEVPFINSYTPSVGHNIPFIESLSGQGVSGVFDTLSLPDHQDSQVAVQVDYMPSGNTALNFVTPTIEASSAIAAPNSFWGDPLTWTADVPITSDVVTMFSSDPLPTRIDLDVGTAASERAFAHVVDISSQDQFAPLTLGIPLGTSLSVINHVAVGENGIVEMSGGAVVTNLVQVDVGGMILGNGTIDGDVILGSGLGGGEATLNPGSLGSAAGVINAENLTINSDGVLAIAIEDVSSFGQVVVEQTTTLGGRLVFDVSNYVAPLGTQFSVIVSGTIDGNFDSVETVGSSTVFIARTPSPPLGALGGESEEYQGYSIGDMNLDNFVDSDDAPDFVLGLLDPIQYWTTHGFMFPVQAGNFHPGSSFDFDDIEGFTDAVEGLVAADIFALIEQMSVPEPTTCALALAALCLAMSRRRSF